MNSESAGFRRLNSDCWISKVTTLSTLVLAESLCCNIGLLCIDRYCLQLSLHYNVHVLIGRLCVFEYVCRRVGGRDESMGSALGYCELISIVFNFSLHHYYIVLLYVFF